MRPSPGLAPSALICVLLFVEEMGLPLPMFPADALLLAAGALIATGVADPRLLLPTLLLLDVVGAVAGFLLARRLGRPGLERLARRLGAEAALERTAGVLRRFGLGGVFGGRLVPGMRVYTNLVAGSIGIPPRTFVLALLPSAAIWIGTVTTVGWVLGRRSEPYLGRLSHFALELGLLFTLGLASYVALSLWAPRVRRPSAGQPSRLPLALIVDLAVSTAFIACLRLLVRGLGPAAQPDGPADYALLGALVVVVYALLSHRAAGATLGEAVVGAPYLEHLKAAVQLGGRGRPWDFLSWLLQGGWSRLGSVGREMGTLTPVRDAAVATLAPPLPGLLSLIVPAHNEAANLGPLMRDLSRELPMIAASFEIVLVDDGSSDDGADVASQALGEWRESLRVVRHQVKSGYGLSVADGLRAARGDYIAFIDGDGQFDPRDLVGLAAELDRADLVAGVRVHRADPLYRSCISFVLNRVVRVVFGISRRDVDCGLKIMSRRLLDAASPLRARSALLNTELFYKAQLCGYTVLQLPVEHRPRTAGVRSGARLRPILRALRELFWLRRELARSWSPVAREQGS